MKHNTACGVVSFLMMGTAFILARNEVNELKVEVIVLKTTLINRTKILPNPVVLPIPVGFDLIAAIEQVESGGDIHAIGDGGRALGCMQIWDVCFDDVKHYPELRGYQYQDVTKRHVAHLVFHAYMRRYATAHRLGHEPTDEDRARIWNGGPNGYKKQSTQKYWEKVKAVK